MTTTASARLSKGSMCLSEDEFLGPSRPARVRELINLPRATLGIRWEIVTRPAHKQRWELNEAARWALWWGALRTLLSHALRTARSYTRADRDRFHFALRAHWKVPPQGRHEVEGTFKDFSLDHWDNHIRRLSFLGPVGLLALRAAARSYEQDSHVRVYRH